MDMELYSFFGMGKQKMDLEDYLFFIACYPLGKMLQCDFNVRQMKISGLLKC